MEAVQETKKSDLKKFAPVAVVAIAAVFILYVFLLSGATGSNVNDVSGGVISKDGKSESQQIQDSLISLLPDGTYSEDVVYKYHAGTEKEGNETIDISITVEDDVVTAVSVEALGTPSPISKKFITGVNDALPELVVGKKIGELNLPKQISGSSLTTAAFKGYVEKILASS